MILDLSQVVARLEGKLNKAIVGNIQQGNSVFESDRETYRFRLCLDTGTYKGYEYLKTGFLPNEDGSIDESQKSYYNTGKFVRYINGLFTINESNVQGIESPNVMFSASLTLCIPIIPGKDDTYYTEEMVGSVRNIIDNAMLLNEFDEFEGFNLGIGYSIGATGEREHRGQVGDSITLTAYFDYALVALGINSSEVKLTIDNTISVYVPRQGISRVETLEADIDIESEEGVSKSTCLSSVLTINFDRPAKKDALGDLITEYLINGVNIGHLVTIEIPNSTGTVIANKIMCFAETAINTENILNASNSITLTEAMTNNEVIQLSPEAELYLQGESTNG